MNVAHLSCRLAIAALASGLLAVDAIGCPPGSAADTPTIAAATPRTPSSRGDMPAEWRRIVDARRPTPDSRDTVVLGFGDTAVTDVLPFLQAATGKPVTARLAQIGPVKISLFGDRPMPRSEALDRVREALLVNNIIVFEDAASIVVEPLHNLAANPRCGLVFGPDDDLGAIACDAVPGIFVFRAGRSDVHNVAAVVQEFLPDYATLVADDSSDQLVLRGTTGLAKRVSRVIAELRDRGDSAGVAGPGPHRADAVPQPLDPDSIAALPRAQAFMALSRVSKAKNQPNLDEPTRTRLNREFVALMNRVRATAER